MNLLNLFPMRNLITGFICVLLFSGSLFAQQSSAINLEEAIEIALQNNVQIKRSANVVDRQETNVMRARTEFLPNLTTSFSTGRTIGRQFDQTAFEVAELTVDRVSTNVQSNITLFSGWENINNLRASRASLSSAEDDYERTRETIIFNTAAQFLEIVLDEELLGIAEDNLETSRRQLEQVEAQVEVGMRPIVDLYNQEATVAGNELAVIRQQNALNLSKTRLIGTLQIDPFRDYDFIAPGIEDQPLEPQMYSLTDLVEQAMTNRRDIRATETFIQAQRYSLEAARGAYYPTISLGASLSSNYSSIFSHPQGHPDAGQTIGFSDQFLDQNINRGLTINVSIPIFNRFNVRTNIQQREIDHKNALLDMESLQVEIFQEVRQAYDDYQSIVKELDATAKIERAAEKAFETEQERYNVGSSTLIELTDANNRYVEAVSNRIQAQFRFVFQEKLLDFYIGRITSDNIDDIMN